MPAANGNLNSSTNSVERPEQLSHRRHLRGQHAWPRNLNTATAANGYVANQLSDAQTQQSSMDTLYKGFISNIQDTNMAQAATQLSLNQTQLQAALAGHRRRSTSCRC